MTTKKQTKIKLPKRGGAWLVRDKYGKMRRAIFFHPDHAKHYKNTELLNLITEVVNVKVNIFRIAPTTKTKKHV